ncbi:MAG: PD-(D/E)XK nuclease family protein, partial [Actinobacteria bacterium]|nr:PD-(D/E)XK nuclease family protein [Actinomycetota bacterium]
MSDTPEDDGALIRGLRLPRHEAQLTQVIAEVCIADRLFAANFVRAILRAAAQNERHARQVAPLLDVPDELDCRAEHHVGREAESGRGLGYVDLAFEGEPDFTLFVENKLHSGFGPDQVERYLT